MKVALLGWNAMKNVGDDAMTVVIIDILQQRLGISNLFLVAENNPDALLFLKPYAEKFSIKYPLFYGKIRRTPGLRGFYHRWLLAPYIILKYDLVIIGGGSIYHSKSGNQVYSNLIKIKKTLKLNRKIVSVGVSVGPFKDATAEASFKYILDNIDFLCVRDRRSFSYCKNLNNGPAINYAPDVALARPLIKHIDTNVKNEIGIILRQGFVTDQITRLLIDTIAIVYAAHPELTFVLHSFCELDDKHENDMIAINQILQEMPDHLKSRCTINRYNSNPDIFYARIGSARINICMRLHGSIISYAMNTPFIMLSYHKKCEDFFEDMGIDRQFLLEDLSDATTMSQIISNTLVQPYALTPHQSSQDSLKNFDFITRTHYNAPK